MYYEVSSTFLSNGVEGGKPNNAVVLMSQQGERSAVTSTEVFLPPRAGLGSRGKLPRQCSEAAVRSLLTPRPSHAGPHVVGPPARKLFLLLLRNGNFATVMS